jgi:hypothetical protein
VNLPDESKIRKPQIIEKYYSKKALWAFIIALNLSYFNPKDTKTKQDDVKDIVNQNAANSSLSDVNYKMMYEFKKFAEDDFSQRFKIKYEGISLNSALKENLYCIFICIMRSIPLIVIGSPGCSKSLAYRIICDVFKNTFD